MIDASKKYRTRDGRAVRILATDINAKRPIVVALAKADKSDLVICLYEDGMRWEDVNSDYDLIEVGPYDDFVIDEPVMAQIVPSDPVWQKRYFAGVDQYGTPSVFPNGLTRWSSGERRVPCHVVRRPTEEGLA